MATEGSTRRLRADAERNRRLILDAAREVFAERGLGVSMRQIAARAGVGEATVLRRFCSREQLVAEAFEDEVSAYADAATAALEHPDPWQGFVAFVERVTGMQLVDKGFAEVLTLTFPRAMAGERERARADDAVRQVIARAQAAGRLRDDVTAEDVVLLLLAHAGVVAVSGRVARKFSARLRCLLLEAFAAPGAGPLPAPPSPAETYRALLRLH